MNYPVFSDEYFMNEALKEARKAFDAGEIPVGALVVANKRIIARASNSTQQLQDVTADVMVMPRSFSSSIQSMVASPSCTSPIRCTRPV